MEKEVKRQSGEHKAKCKWWRGRIDIVVEFAEDKLKELAQERKVNEKLKEENDQLKMKVEKLEEEVRILTKTP